MDLQGAMSEPDKQKVRDRAFDVIREYRDRGCPQPFVPDPGQMRAMFDVMSAGTVTEEFVDYVAADLRFSDADQCGPALASTPEQRSDFPVVASREGYANALNWTRALFAGRPQAEIDAIFGGNAERIFFARAA